jgi:hypothetical protein
MENQYSNNIQKIVLSHPFEIDQPKDFELHEGFPNCCEEHKNEFKTLEEFSNRLSFYLNNELPLVKEYGIDTAELLEDLPLRVLKAVCFSQHMISLLINSEEWHKDISKYIEKVVDSLGDRLLGLDYYVEVVIYFVDNNSTIPHNKRNEVLKMLYNQKDTPSSNQIVKDLNLLCATYEKWLDYFPFVLSFFSDLKEELSSSIPIFKTTDYQGEDSLAIATQPELIEFLNQKTKHILSQVDTVKLFSEGQITDIEKTKLDLINQEHQHKQRVLLDTFRKGEKKYTNTLNDWFKNEKKYFSSIVPVALQKESQKKFSKYFELKDSKTKYESATILADKLISKGLIEKNSRANLINAFTGSKPKEKISWIGNFGDLKSFIKHCRIELEFNDTKNQWITASEVFTRKSLDFSSEEISNASLTKNDKNIQKLVKSVL